MKRAAAGRGETEIMMFCCAPVGPDPETPRRCLRPAAWPAGRVLCPDHLRCFPADASASDDALVAYVAEDLKDGAAKLTRVADFLAAVRRTEDSAPDGRPRFLKRLARAVAEGGEARDVPPIAIEYLGRALAGFSPRARTAGELARYTLARPLCPLTLGLLDYAASPCECLDESFSRDVTRNFDAVLSCEVPSPRTRLCAECVRREPAAAATPEISPRQGLRWLRDRFPEAPRIRLQGKVTWA